MTPFCVLNTTKNGLQIMSLAAYASETNYWQQIFEKQKTCEVKFNEKRLSRFRQQKRENRTKRAKGSNKQFIKARLQYLQRKLKLVRATSRAARFTLLSRSSRLIWLILSLDILVGIINRGVARIFAQYAGTHNFPSPPKRLMIIQSNL